MEVDTSFAKAYLDHDPEIKDPVYKTRTKRSAYSYHDIEDLDRKLRALAHLVESEKTLFCQLEYLIRGKPMEEVEAYDIKLIVNNLMYYSDYCKHTDIDEIKYPKTAAVCKLFTQLCNDAGLPAISLEIVDPEMKEPETIYSVRPFGGTKEIENGCTGIITRRSDVDSAVEALLHAPKTYPWAVRNIYVEESAVERFKQAISWKANSTDKSLEDISPSCSNAYCYLGTLYLYQYVGTHTDKHVHIHSYRTVKDLFSLLEPSLCVSLWSSDVAESQEIAKHLRSNIVWINDLGNFNGPPKTAQSVYSLIRRDRATYKTNAPAELKKLETLQAQWLKKDIFDRRNDILGFMNWKRENVNFEIDDMAHTGDTFTCFGRMSPDGVVYDHEEVINTVAFLGYLIRGGAALLYSRRRSDLYDHLVSIGAPMVFLEKKLEYLPGGDMTAYCRIAYRYKVVWSSFGTVFAN
ncbi:unnamed protein product [Leptosia nina]|uniref:Uncharacterized protein n=1 Tax=Leptosia nina TaxID=320188 RepID=A0AAV1JWB9_9NEOP